MQKHSQYEFAFSAIVATFNEFCGDVSPMDDVTLACIPCTSKIMHTDDIVLSDNIKTTGIHHDGRFCYMESAGSNLRATNPVPVVIDEVHKIYEHSVSADKLSGIMTTLYENVIEYGAPEDYIDEADSSGNKTDTNNRVNDIYIRMWLNKVEHNGEPAFLIRMEDCGKEVTHNQLTS